MQSNLRRMVPKVRVSRKTELPNLGSSVLRESAERCQQTGPH